MKIREANRRLLDCAIDGDLGGVVSALDAGADINVQCKGTTALIWAVVRGHTEIVEKLIRTGADVNIQDGDGWTALMWVAIAGYIDITKKLVQAGADPFIEAEDGRTALDIAREKGYPHIIVNLIEQRMAELKSTELVQSIEDIEIHDMSRRL